MNTDRNPTPRAGRRPDAEQAGNRRRSGSPTRYDGPRYGRTPFTPDGTPADAFGPERSSHRRQRPERHPDHDTAREERRRERPGPRGSGGRRGGRGGRRRDVRGAVLVVLADEPMHGYQVMQALTERSNGTWRPSPGAIYPVLAALEDEGLVTISADSGRKVAALTPEGEATAARVLGEGPDPFAAREQEGPDLREALHGLAQAAREVSRTGTPDQARQAHEVLARARRHLYAVLAQEPSGEPSAEHPSPSASTSPTSQQEQA